MGGIVEYPPIIWSHIDPLGTDLVKKLLVVDVAKRLTVNEALRHPWCIKGLNLLKEQGGPLGEMATAELDFQTKTMGPTLVLSPGENRFKKVGEEERKDIDVEEEEEEEGGDKNSNCGGSIIDDDCGGFIRDDENNNNDDDDDSVSEPPEKKFKI